MTLFSLLEVLRNWKAFLETAEPRLAAIIREEWPQPPSFDAALAAIGGPPGSKACAAFAEALAAIDDRCEGGKKKYAAITSAKESELPLEGEIIPPPAAKRGSRKAKSGVMELDGRPSKRAQALVREQLKHGPRPESTVMAAAHLADIPKRTLIAAADALGVRTRRGQWWLPG